VNSERFLFFAAGAFGTALAVYGSGVIAQYRAMRRARWYVEALQRNTSDCVKTCKEERA
jgi:hypothetical protein